MLLFTFALAAATCTDTSLDALNRTLQQSFAAYSNGQLPLFEASLREAQAALPCLTDPIDRQTADRLHFAEALLCREAGFPDAEQYLSACCAPSWSGPLPFQQLQDQARPWLTEERNPPTPDRRLPRPLSGQLAVDGERGVSGYSDKNPYVFQQVWRDGRVGEPVYVRPGEPAPHYVRLRPILASIALGGLLISGTGFLGADLTRQELDSESWGSGELQTLRNLQFLNNAAFITGIGGGVVGLGATTWLVVSFK